MAEEEVEEEYYILEEEYEPPDHPQFERIKRQFLACSSTFLGALAFGICSTDLIHEFMEYKLNLGWEYEYIFWQPMVGDTPGIILAVPMLFFLGRRSSLILSQLFFLGTLLVKEYFHEQQSALKYHLRLPEEFLCMIGLHGCVRIHFIVTVVYVVEVTQPSHRGPMLAAFFPFFTIGLYMGHFSLRKSHALLYSLVLQTCSLLMALLAPESPYWQARKGDYEGARGTFRRLRGGDEDADELAALLASTAPDAEHPSLLATFCWALAKMVFLYMGSDSVCRIFMTPLTSPLHCFRYDNTFEHEIFVTDEPSRHMYLYPIFGSLAFLLVCPFLGRRILYLLSIFATLLIFYARKKHITFDMEDARVRSAELCYFASHMGAMQVVLLVGGEIFPGKVREFGVAICELMQFGIQYADFSWMRHGTHWDNYSEIRLALIPLGIILTFVFLPETKNKTLIEAEEAGGKMVPVFLSTPAPSDELASDEENPEAEE